MTQLIRFYSLSFFLFFSTLGNTIFAQNINWTKTNDQQVRLESYMVRAIIPQSYDVWQADFKQLKTLLDKAPLENSAAARNAPLSFDLPLPNIGLVRFKVVESPVYAEALVAKYPQFKSFSAVGGEKNEYFARFDYTVNGFNAAITTPEGEVYIDPYATEQTHSYITYFTKNCERKILQGVQLCGATHDVANPDFNFQDTKVGKNALSRNAGELVTLRKYRLALAATGEFSQIHGGTKEKVLGYLVTLANRCTKTFFQETAIRFELVANNDTLIFLDKTKDPYLKGDVGKDILSISDDIIKPRIGLSNYDIGHTITGNCTDVGGVANSGVICVSGAKGNGMSCDNGGGGIDGFAVSIMCHEMGHQFTASHTMSACDGQDQSQVASSSAIEPGSGSTIMSYDGSCGSNNISGQYWKPNGYYSTGTLEQIINFSRNGAANNCPERTVSTNHFPDVTIPLTDGFFIPMKTPFQMTAQATDQDNDVLKYCWEQADEGMYIKLGVRGLFSNDFRSFDPVSTPTRVFPRLTTILTGTNQLSELLPDTTRNMTFRCTVRDYNSNASATIWDEVKFKATHTAGPFLVTYPNTAQDTMIAGEYTVIKWNVANTDGNLVNCQNVNIILSTDGGNNGPIILAKNTPNDGEEGVIIPVGTVTKSARVRINAANNIFFDISNKNHVVQASVKKGYTFTAASQRNRLCLPDAIQIDLATVAVGGFDKKISFAVVDGLPQGAIAIFEKDSINANDTTKLQLDLAKVTVAGAYNVKIRAIAGTDTLFRTVRFNAIYSNFDDATLTTPANGTTGQNTLPSFKWAASAVADNYDFELASNPSFAANTIIFKKENVKANEINTPVTLQENSLYFWRIKARNTCKTGDYVAPNAFHTLIQTCKDYTKEQKINITSGAANTYESEISIAENGILSDLNVRNIKGNHVDFGNLELAILSPSGKTATLVSKKCATIEANFNLSFDDEAAAPFNCSAVSALAPIFKPATPMSVFDNEDIKGAWKLSIKDTKNGDGGLVESWALRFCFSGSVIAPTVVKNDTLRVRKGKDRFIDKITLLATDDKSPDTKLTYTLVTAPRNGSLDKAFGKIINVGETFTQAEISQGATLRYVNNNAATENTDYFLFVVTDGDGGFVGTLRYNIIRDEKAITGTSATLIDNALKVYPNPSKDLFNVSFLSDAIGETLIELYSAQGQIIASQQFATAQINTQFSTETIPSGVYFLKISTLQGNAIRKIIVQK